ncbi:alpha-N-acetylgalactosaminide alpha-2,6-sialyltransferase 1 [Orycteropus afer afer]|uniref:alpha-N-acetylgalactosaminide alpha-2,6-sialyltransferase n=1 Tax=Orycteropus afer afer TaxID=1230840 RepID=A0A8B7BEV9_ORYAF|nr:alpha-N-acetylgalactosaminide alpha-2,6-sialyltransferase 1 [Orycteropus afer afer]
MRGCPRRLGRLGQAVQWPLLLALLVFFLFTLPSFVKEPDRKPSRYQDTENIQRRSPGSTPKANSQAPAVRRKMGTHGESARETHMLNKQPESIARVAKETRPAGAWGVSPREQHRAPPTAKAGEPESQGEEKTTEGTLSLGTQEKQVPTDRTGLLSQQSQDTQVTRGRGQQHPHPTTPRTGSVRRRDTGATAAETLTTVRAEGGTTAVGREKSPPASIRPRTKAKVRLKGPTAQAAQRLRAANFQSEPRWDFEENYSLEVGGLQTTCPDSVKVKAAQSRWLQPLFLPNLTLFLDSRRFNQSEWDRLEHFAPPFGFMELNYSLVQRVVTRFPPVPQQQLLLAGLPAGEPRCVSCAVVGNGGILNNSRVGQEIDSHNYVFRLSGAVIKGYEQDVGTRTSFYGFTAFSLAQSLLLLGNRGFQHVPLEKDVRYLHILEGTRDYEWLEALLLNQTLMENNFHWFRRRPLEAFRDALHLDRYLLLHPDLLRYMKNRFLRSKTLDTSHWRIYRPTTGALLLLTALQLCDRVSAYGFITSGHERFSDHYYDKSWKPLIFYMNHDFKLERALWKRLHDEGLIRLYQRPEPPQ